MIVIRNTVGKIQKVVKEEKHAKGLAIDIKVNNVLRMDVQELRIIAIYGEAGAADTHTSIQKKAKNIDICEWLDTVSTHENSIIAGDFNSVPNVQADTNGNRKQNPYNTINVVMNKGYRDAHRELHENRTDFTYNNETVGSRIDNILAKGDKMKHIASGILIDNFLASMHWMAVVDYDGINLEEGVAVRMLDRNAINWRKLNEKIEMIKQEGEFVSFIDKARSEEGHLKEDEIRSNVAILSGLSVRDKDAEKILDTNTEQLFEHMKKLESAIQEKAHNITMKKPKIIKKEQFVNYLSIRDCTRKLVEYNKNPRDIRQRDKCTSHLIRIKKDIINGYDAYYALASNTLETLPNFVDTIECNEYIENIHSREELCRWLKALKDEIKKNLAKIRRKGFKAYIDGRRADHDKMDMESFFAKVKGKKHMESGYMPSVIKQNGKSKVPVSDKEILEATIQEHGWLNNTTWPREILSENEIFYIEGTDDLGEITYWRKQEIDPAYDDLYVRHIVNNLTILEQQKYNWNILGMVNRNISDREIEAYCKKSKKKASGPTGIKINTIRMIGGIELKWVCAIASCMLRLGVIPKKCTYVNVVHIPKATAGTRPLGLIEELTKLTAYVMTERLSATEQALDPVFLTYGNWAYKKGRGVPDCLLIDIIRGTWEERDDRIRNDFPRATHGEELIRFEYDLNGWFDGIPHALIETTARALNLPENVINFWNQMQNKAEYKICTKAGPTEPIKPLYGVTQGAQESPLKSLIALIVWYRIVGTYMEDAGLDLDNRIELDGHFLWAMHIITYADDGAIYIRASKLDEFLTVISTLSKRLCICLKHEKIELTAWSSRIIGKSVTIETYDWKLGKMTKKVFTIKQARTSKWKTLGVRTGGLFTDKQQEEYIVKQTEKIIDKLYTRNLNYEELRTTLESFWISQQSHGALGFTMDLDALIKIERYKDKLVRRTLAITEKTPNEFYTVEYKEGGLNLPNFISTRMQNLARELFCYLNSTGTSAGDIVRVEFDELIKLHDKYKTTSTIHRAINDLAGFGIYIRKYSDITLNRMLDFLALKEEKTTMDTKMKKSKVRYHKKFSSVSVFAKQVRAGLNSDANLIENKEEWGQYVHNRDVDAVAEAHEYAKQMAKNDAEAEARKYNTTIDRMMKWDKNREIRTSCIDLEDVPIQDECKPTGWNYTDGSIQSVEGRKLAGGALCTISNNKWHIEKHRWPMKYGNKETTIQMVEGYAFYRAINEKSDYPIVTDSLVTCYLAQKGRTTTDGYVTEETAETCDMCGRKPADVAIPNYQINACEACLGTRYGHYDPGRTLTKVHNAPLYSLIINKVIRINSNIIMKPGEYHVWKEDAFNESMSSTYTFLGSIGKQKKTFANRL